MNSPGSVIKFGKLKRKLGSCINCNNLIWWLLSNNRDGYSGGWIGNGGGCGFSHDYRCLDPQTNKQTKPIHRSQQTNINFFSLCVFFVVRWILQWTGNEKQREIVKISYVVFYIFPFFSLYGLVAKITSITDFASVFCCFSNRQTNKKTVTTLSSFLQNSLISLDIG